MVSGQTIILIYDTLKLLLHGDPNPHIYQCMHCLHTVQSRNDHMLCGTPMYYGYKTANKSTTVHAVLRSAGMSPAPPQEPDSQVLQQRAPCHLAAY